MNENRKMEYARTKVNFDRWGLPHRQPGCQADQLALGWVPGVRYRDPFAGEFTCTGYTADGRVEIRDKDGRVRQHLTAVGRTVQVIGAST